MSERAPDGSAGDAGYGVIGASYSGCRQPDPRLAAAIATEARRHPSLDTLSNAFEGQLRTRPEYEGSLVLVVAEP